jgi:hypothetical protein
MLRGSKHTKESLAKMSVSNSGRRFSDDHRRNMSNAMRGKKHKPFSDKARENMSKAHLGKKLKPFTEDHIKNLSKPHRIDQCGEKNPMYGRSGEKSPNYGKRRPYNVRLKIIEGQIGGFWYGAVRYKDKIYCERWCPDLWRRIDEAQHYQSILSGKTKGDIICRDGKVRALFRHHVYWQPKACCEWDEDTNGYYAWIDIGTARKPNRVKYYIPGDPNKFVLLTAHEHGMVAKDKLKWIKIFEELIETKLGGVCYLPRGVV